MAQHLSDDEKLLIRRGYDKLDICEKRYSQSCTGFLNEREQDILLTEFEKNDRAKVFFCGGYENAERRALVFVPEYLELDENELFCAIRCKYYKEYVLNHRDFLGSLMGLGIERETVGDIILNCDEHYADIVLKREILPFVLSEFKTAGRAALTVTEISIEELSLLEIKTQSQTDTVLSPRIDAIVASGFNLSRENASALVKSGKVYLNRRLVSEPDKTVSDSSLINAVGYGKFKVFITGNTSKKGRIFIRIEKYI